MARYGGARSALAPSTCRPVPFDATHTTSLGLLPTLASRSTDVSGFPERSISLESLFAQCRLEWGIARHLTSKGAIGLETLCRVADTVQSAVTHERCVVTQKSSRGYAMWMQ